MNASQNYFRFYSTTLLLVSIFLSGCGAGGAGMFRFRAENWEPEPGGSIQASEVGSIGDLLDVEDVLGLTSREGFWVYGLEADLGVGTFEVTNFDYSSMGSNTLADTIVYSGETFPAGAILESDFGVAVSTYRSKGSLIGLGPIQLKYIWGVDHLELGTTLTAGAVSGSESIDEWVPSFGLGATFSAPIGNSWSVELDGEIAGLWISYGDIDGSYQGMTIRGGIRQGSGMLVGVGHRSLVIDVTDDGAGTSADVDLGGSYAFLEWAF
ncbi:MAG: hypothetical protein VYD70_01735 [Planctomycetota bacterium]|nr:hypothetical protein [Planctomycetota bacterium]